MKHHKPLESAEEVAEAVMISAAAKHELPRIPGVNLSRTRRQILGLLLARSQVHREIIYAVLYSDAAVDDRPNMATVDVHMSHLKKRMRGIVEITYKDGCWAIDTAGKSKIRDLQAAEIKAPLKNRKQVIVGAIEKGVPIPQRVSKRGSRYPWANMEIGDSFFAEGGRSDTLRATFFHWRKKTGTACEDWTCLFRDVDEEGRKGARAWRIK